MVSLTPVAGAVQLQTSSQGLVQFQTLPLPPPIPFPLFPFLLTHPTAIFEFCTIMCAPCCPQNCTNTPVGCNTTMNIYSVSASCVCVCVCVCVCAHAVTCFYLMHTFLVLQVGCQTALISFFQKYLVIIAAIAIAFIISEVMWVGWSHYQSN